MEEAVLVLWVWFLRLFVWGLSCSCGFLTKSMPRSLLRGSYLRRYINTSYIVHFGDIKQFGGPHKSVAIWRICHRNACQKSSWIKVKRHNKYDGIWTVWFLFF